MPRPPLAVLLSSAWLWTAIAASALAAPATVPPTTAIAKTASTANQPPLPPGRAVGIRKAQGGAEDDLGIGVIIASWVGAAALILWVVSDHDDDNSTAPTTGTH